MEKKYSTANECNKIFAKLVEERQITQPISGHISNTHINRAKKEIKKSIQAEVRETWDKKINLLVMQGNVTIN